MQKDLRRVVRMHCMYPFRDLFDGIVHYVNRGVYAANGGNFTVLNQPLPDHFLTDVHRHDLGASVYLELYGEGCMFTRALDTPLFIDRLRVEAKRCTLVLQPFIVSKAAIELVAAVPGMTLAGSRFNLVEKINNKLFARQLFEKVGMDLLQGNICKSEQEIRNAAARLRRSGVRQMALIDPSPYAASGKGLIGRTTISSDDRTYEMQLQGILQPYSRSYRNLSVILTEWSDEVVSSPSVIGYIDAQRRVNFIATTSQVFEGVGSPVYRGSIIPAQESPEVILDLYRCFTAIANQLVKRDWVGVFGIDFIVVRSGTGVRVIPTEINGRYTGSMYLANAMRRLPPHDWFGYCLNVAVPLGTTYCELRTAIELVSDRPSEKVLAFNVGPLHLGKSTVMVLIDPSREQKPRQRAEVIFDEIEHLLSPLRKQQYYELAAS